METVSHDSGIEIRIPSEGDVVGSQRRGEEGEAGEGVDMELPNHYGNYSSRRALVLIPSNLPAVPK